MVGWSSLRCYRAAVGAHSAPPAVVGLETQAAVPRMIRVTVVPQWGQVPIRAQCPDRSAALAVTLRSTAQWHW